jgi:hypothetical protein
MHNRGQLIIGAALVLLGIAFFIGTIFQINVWAICFPVGLILIGVWLVARPNLGGDKSIGSEVVLIGDVRRRGNWVVRSQEFWLGIGDVDLDFASAEIPTGETRIMFYSFVSDIKIYIPKDVGVSIYIYGFFNEADLLNQKQESFLSPVEVTSSNYAAAERRLRFEMTGFINEIKVRH